MRGFLLFAFLCSFASFAEDDSLPQQTQSPMVRLWLIEKLYSEVTNVELPLGKDLHYGNLQVHVDRCIVNDNNEPFALLTILDSGTPFYSGWTPINEYNLYPVQHTRYDVTVATCSTYENIKTEKGKKEQ